MPKNESLNVRRLVTSGILIGVAVALSLVKLFQMPFGGEVTLGAMIPLLIISYRYGSKWGVFSATVYGLLQMVILGFFGLAGTPLDFAIVIFLDYIAAFAVIGLADLFRKPFRNKYLGYGFSCAAVMLLRFLFHTLSGVIIWTVAFPPEIEIVVNGVTETVLMNPWIYSLGYNVVILVEMILTLILISAPNASFHRMVEIGKKI